MSVTCGPSGSRVFPGGKPMPGPSSRGRARIPSDAHRWPLSFLMSLLEEDA